MIQKGYKAGYKSFIENEFKIVNKKSELVPFAVNNIQDDYLSNGTGKDVILKARQMGFSSIILAIFAVDFLMKENSYSIVVADISENATDLLERVKQYIQSYEETNKTKVNLKYNSKYELFNLDNNARYKIGTADNREFGRSKTITNLHLSEFAFYPDAKRLFTGAMQAVVPSGRVIIETTANGFNFFKTFWDECEKKERPFEPMFFRASNFYDAEFLANKKRELKETFAQEYPETPQEAFLTSGQLFFDKNALSMYSEETKEPISTNGGVLFQFRDLEPGEFIVAGADTAAGGLDYSACQFVSKTHNDVPLVYYSKATTTVMTNDLLEVLNSIHEKTNVQPVIAYERNFGGSFELERLNTLNRTGKFKIFKQMEKVGTGLMDTGQKMGWTTTATNRHKMLEDLKNAIDTRTLRIYHSDTVNELFNFIVKQTHSGWKAQAETGAHDDLVMSLAIALQVFQYSEQPKHEVVDPNIGYFENVDDSW